MSEQLPGKRWIKAIQYISAIAGALTTAFGGYVLIVTNFNIVAVATLTLVLIVDVAVAVLNRFLNRWIDEYGHAYDHNPIALRLMAHANEVRTSEEGG